MDTRVRQAPQTDQATEAGRSVPRLEGQAKVTGRAEYIHNLRLPGMPYGRIFRSTVAHGRIRSIGTSADRAAGGVHSVVTGEDVRRVIADPCYGPAFHDQPILALEKARYVGEPVAPGTFGVSPAIANAVEDAIGAGRAADRRMNARFGIED